MNGAYPGVARLQPLSEPGFIPGVEAAGTVAVVGEGVDAYSVGQRVFALTGRGAYAESVVADARDVVRLPEGVSAAHAIAPGVNALVASLGLERANVKKGERVLVRGAGGSIGLMAAQLAALSGGEVTAITSSPERGDRLRGLGGGTAMITSRFDAEGALPAIERHQITHSQWVPTMLFRLLRLPRELREGLDLSSHQCAIHAAAPCPPQLKRQLIDWWGSIVWEYYSGTEGNGVTCLSAQEWLARPGSVGYAVLGATCRRSRQSAGT